MKYAEFLETKIIISGSLYSDFIKSFKWSKLDIFIAPKIIVFTKNKENFIKENKFYKDGKNILYDFARIATSFDGVKKFLKNKIPNKLIYLIYINKFKYLY